MRALGQVGDQAGDVVGNGRHRQPLHRGLQFQLHALAVIHRGQNFLVALVLLNFHARAQQITHSRHPLRQRVLAVHGPLTGAARGREAPLHELLDGQQPRQALLAQIVNAFVHQLKVGLAGRKARVGGRVFALHLPGQTRQPIQQLGLVIALGLANRLRQICQLSLGRPQHHRCLARGRQAQQRRHAVGFNLQHPLHQAPQTAGADAVRRFDQDARIAIRMDGEIGTHLGVPHVHCGTGQGVVVEHVLDHMPHALTVALRIFQDPQMHAAQTLPGQIFEPLLRHFFDRRRRVACIQGGIRSQRHHERPADKLGVQLPAQAECTKVHPQVGAVGIRPGAVVVMHQSRQVRAAGLPLGGVRQHHQVGDGGRAAHRLRRAGMHFVVQQGTQWMLGRLGQDRHRRCKRDNGKQLLIVGLSLCSETAQTK